MQLDNYARTIHRIKSHFQRKMYRRNSLKQRGLNSSTCLPFVQCQDRSESDKITSVLSDSLLLNIVH